MLLIHNYGTNDVSMWLCGGGAAVKLGNTVASPPLSGTVTYTAGISGYTWTNNNAGACTVAFTQIKTRQS
jgi:hypothetical protein